jgi:glucose/arabinose dehydrogenase
VAEWVAAIAAILAALVAIVALAVALRAKEVAETANDIAKAGNTLAETANDTAADALVEAETANDTAVEANRLSGDANTIARRALDVAQDDVPYNWALEVGDDGVAVVRNDCGHRALQAVVTLDSGGEVIAEAGPVDVAAFDKITLDANVAVEQHFQSVRANPVVYAHSEGGVFFGGRNGIPVSVTFRASVRWHTEQGIPRNDVVREVLRHQMTHEGINRVEERPRRKRAVDD